MLIKLLGWMDGISAITIILTKYVDMSTNIFYLIGLYLICKGVLFTIMAQDIASMIDIACGLYAIAIMFGVSIPILSMLVGVYLLQKAFISLVRLG